MSLADLSGLARLRDFLARNPFPDPHVLGFFYREKMRAIHRVAPDERFGPILEVGGGESGLTGLLYPGTHLFNVDLDQRLGFSPPNRRPGTHFAAADAVRLPFPEHTFDAVTMFDLLEHVPDDGAALSEALRVLRPGGWLLISTPHLRWRYPYHRAFRRFVPSERVLWEEWGHVRRGYSLDRLEQAVGWPCERWATFINPITVIGHDLAFSELRYRRRLVLLLSPVTWLGYFLHPPHGTGTEIAAAWRKPAA